MRAAGACRRRLPGHGERRAFQIVPLPRDRHRDWDRRRGRRSGGFTCPICWVSCASSGTFASGFLTPGALSLVCAILIALVGRKARLVPREDRRCADVGSVRARARLSARGRRTDRGRQLPASRSMSTCSRKTALLRLEETAIAQHPGRVPSAAWACSCCASVLGGKTTAAQMRMVADLAERYGHPSIHTTRAGLEIHHAKIADVPASGQSGRGAHHQRLVWRQLRNVIACAHAGRCRRGAPARTLRAVTPRPHRRDQRCDEHLAQDERGARVFATLRRPRCD